MLTRLRWTAYGLRGRLVGMVLVTTVATLGVAAVGLLPRLESALQNASKTALTNDIKTHNSELRQLDNTGYSYLALAANPVAMRDKTLRAKYDNAEKALTSIQLQTDLGATGVLLFGYVDRSGQGALVSTPSVEGSGRSAVPKSLVQNAGSAVARTFLDVRKRGPFYKISDFSILQIGPKEYVRVAVPLRKADAVLVAYKSIDDIPDAVNAVAHAFELAAAAGLLLTLLLAIPLAGTLVRRLRRLRQAALHVAVAGAGVEFPVDRARDEVGDLARSFAIMQRRLRHQEEARRAFVATASHELRTPLASLDGMLELLADDLHDDDELDLDDAKALLERARVQSRRLGRLAADLLDLSRIDADVDLRSEPVELGELSRAVIAEFELAMSDRGVAGVLHDDVGPVWALGDPGSVARILRILLDNALRVSPRGSEVQVLLHAAPVPTLSVVDRGPGVAPEERALIFERFKRGRDTGGEAGFGLGLAIGRELAERMGGALVLAGTGPGATFTLTLPHAEAPAPDRVPSPAGV